MLQNVACVTTFLFLFDYLSVLLTITICGQEFVFYKIFACQRMFMKIMRAIFTDSN